MKIEKEYDVQELANELKESIEDYFNREARNVLVNPITAQGIVDVLETVASKGEFIMCRVEEAPKETPEHECFGSHINGNEKCNLCVYEKDCMIETEERGEKCFKKSDGKRPTIICGSCKHAEQCEALTKHE